MRKKNKLKRVRVISRHFDSHVYQPLADRNLNAEKIAERLSHLKGRDYLMYTDKDYPGSLLHSRGPLNAELKKYLLSKEGIMVVSEVDEASLNFSGGVDFPLCKGVVAFSLFAKMFRFLVDKFSDKDIAEIIYSIMGRGNRKLVLDLEKSRFDMLTKCSLFSYFKSFNYLPYKSSNLSSMVLVVLERPGVSRFKFNLKRYKTKEPSILYGNQAHSPTGNCQLGYLHPSFLKHTDKPNSLRGIARKPLALTVFPNKDRLGYREVARVPLDDQRSVVIADTTSPCK